MRKKWLIAIGLLAVTTLVAAACNGGDGTDTKAQPEGTYLMGADGLLSDTFIEIPATEGMFLSGPAVEGPAYEQFVADYEAEYGEAPIQAFHAHSYDAATLLLTKVEEVATHGSPLTIDRQALRDALYATEGFEGLTGSITCDVFGDCADPLIKVFHNTAQAVTLDEVKEEIVFEYDPGEDPLGTTGATAPDYAPAKGSVTYGPGEPIQIGALQAISGDTASLGEDQVRAIELAITDFGPIFDHEVELAQVEDGECDAGPAETAAQNLAANADTLVGVIGTSCSGEYVAAGPILEEAGLSVISGSNTAPYLTSVGGQAGTDNHAGYYRIAHNDAIQGAAAAEFVYNDLGVTQAATINDGDPYTSGMTDEFGKSFEELGGTITLATAVSPDDTDMRAVLTQVKNSGAGIVFFPIFQPAGDFIAKQAQEIFPNILTELPA